MKKTPCLETYHATTPDGWRIALHRYAHQTRERLPVLLVHGLASNRHNFDFPIEENSFAKFLWKKGWDTWVIELRGAGKSTKPKGWEWFTKQWSFDHYVKFDLPSAIELILEKTGHSQIHWVGHSLGGILIYPYVKLHSSKSIKSVVTLGTPMTLGQAPGYWKWAGWIKPLFHLVPLMPYRTLVKLYHLHPRWARKANDRRLYAMENMDPRTLRIGVQVAIDDVSSGVMRQVHDWIQGKKFGSSDGKINYLIDPKDFKIPLMVLTGSYDPFTPAQQVGPVFEKIGSKKKKWIVFGKDYGFKTEYGHIDLILGRHAPREVYPTISGWLEENGD